jgi:hypothetical protein
MYVQLNNWKGGKGGGRGKKFSLLTENLVSKKFRTNF